MILKETHTAVVADNKDPEERFRVKVKCAAILGSEDSVLNVWVKPKFPWGFIIVPDVGEQIEIEMPAQSDTDEVPGQAFLDSPDIRWTGVRFQGPGAYEEMFKTNYGKRRGFVTPAGHILMYDDTPGQEKINLVWHNADNKYAMFSANEDGSILLVNKNGSMVYLNAVNKETAMIDEHGNSISSNDKGIKLVDKSGGLVDLDAANKLIQVQAGTVYCGGLTGTEPAILGTTMIALFADHIHPTATGPSGPAATGSGGTPSLWATMKSKVLQLI